PCFLIGLLPTGAHIRLNGLFLPDGRTAIPLMPFLVDEALEGTPATPLFLLAHLSAARMLLADAQYIMPLALLAQAHQRSSGQSTVSEQRTVCLWHEGTHCIEQPCHDVPLPFLPGLLPRHHRPGDGQH